jgi:hypothetical protein
MRINCHKINSSIENDIFWEPKPFYCYFEMTLHVGIAFKIWYSLKVA